jgi:LysR family hydrogen peroxide-inducible transcriptional activator
MPGLHSLRQLRYAMALAEYANFTRAAAACFVTQSTLSAGIRELEESLGVILFERDKQSVIITPAGADVVARAKQIMTAVADLEQSVRGYGLPWGGLCRMGVIPTIAPFVLPRLLPMLRERFSGVLWRLEENQTAVLLSAVIAGELDVALIAIPVDTRGLALTQVAEEALWLVGPQGDPRLVAGCQPDAGAVVLLSEGHCLRAHALAACREPDRVGEVTATSLTTLLAMVAQGFGLTVLPEMIVRSRLLADSGLDSVALPAPAPRRGIAIVSRPTFYDQSALAILVESLSRFLAESPS